MRRQYGAIYKKEMKKIKAKGQKKEKQQKMRHKQSHK